MPALYSEIAAYPAAWMRRLIAAGHIADGVVVEGDIRELEPTDLARYGQCHFFSGIGGWSYALRLAGWPDDRPVWTGSCPCQPWSIAGAKRGTDDERDLWPDWFKLIRVCRPPVLFGEQVASNDAMGWLDTVYADLEGEGYACAAVDLCAAGINAPHIRQRLYWMAHAQGRGLGMQRWASGPAGYAAGGGPDCGLGHAPPIGLDARPVPESLDWASSHAGGPGELYTGRLGHAGQPRLSLREQSLIPGAHRDQEGRAAQQPGPADQPALRPAQQPGRPLANPWAELEWLDCTDGKARPTQPGLFPLAHGLPRNLGALGPELRGLAELAGLSAQSIDQAQNHRVGCLKAYGNAIVAQLAAVFVAAAMQIIDADPAPDLSHAN